MTSMTRSDVALTTMREDPFDAMLQGFRPWLQALIEEMAPRYIVGVARGAIRCIQLYGPDRFPSETHFLSDAALPFISDGELKNARILVVDDSIIFGSTMARVNNYLLSRDAIVSCAAYVADRTSFYGETEASSTTAHESPFARLPVIVQHKCWPHAIRRHHARLVRSVLASVHHYNLDFPTFSLTGHHIRPDDVHNASNAIRTLPSVSALVDVTSPTSANAQFFHYTAFLHEDFAVPLITGARLRSRPKFRLLIAPTLGEIRFTPIIQLALPANANPDTIGFVAQHLDALWKRLRIEVPPSDPFYSQGLFRMLTAVAGLDLALRFGDQLKAHLATAGLDLRLSLIPEDLSLVLGWHNARQLSEAGFGPLGSAQNSISRLPTCPVVPDSPALPDEVAIRDATVAHIVSTPDLRTSSADSTWEIVGKVFLALRSVTDSDQARRLHPDHERLEHGLTFGVLQSIVCRVSGRDLADNELNETLDSMIDRGLVVPKIVERGDEWLRVFYCGEDEDDQDTLQFKSAFHDAYLSVVQRKHGRPLHAFDLQKLSVVLKSVLPWLPITNLPYKFGYVSVPLGGVPRIDWLTEGEAAPCEEERVGTGFCLLPRADYPRAVAVSWPPTAARNFQDAFDFVASAFTKLKDDAKLLLSTCRTHRHTFNAIAFEVRAWCGLERSAPGFDRIPVLARRLLEGLSAGEEEIIRYRLQQGLYWAIRFVSEARIKHAVFARRFTSLKHKAGRVFEAQGPAASRWWDMVLACGLLDSTRDPEIEARMEVALPLLEAAKLLTTYCYSVVLESGVLSRPLLQETFATFGASLDYSQFDWLNHSSAWAAAHEYNRLLSRAKVPTRALLEDRLPEGDFEATREYAIQAFVAVRECVQELRQSVEVLIRRYDVTESEFPYAPEARRRPLRDGSIEVRRDNVFLLTLDIIGSTNSPQTLVMKDRIRDVFRQLACRGLQYQDTGDDGYVACADDVGVLWDAAVAIRLEGAGLIIPEGERFGGTRKALYFGSIAIITRPSGDVFLRDIRFPHVLPQAFAILSGIDRHAPENMRNDLVIVDARTFDKAAQRLRLQKKHSRRVLVESKHYIGECYLVPLKSQ